MDYPQLQAVGLGAVEKPYFINSVFHKVIHSFQRVMGGGFLDFLEALGFLDFLEILDFLETKKAESPTGDSAF